MQLFYYTFTLFIPLLYQQFTLAIPFYQQYTLSFPLFCQQCTLVISLFY